MGVRAGAAAWWYEHIDDRIGIVGLFAGDDDPVVVSYYGDGLALVFVDGFDVVYHIKDF